MAGSLPTTIELFRVPRESRHAHRAAILTQDSTGLVVACEPPPFSRMMLSALPKTFTFPINSPCR